MKRSMFFVFAFLLVGALFVVGGRESFSEQETKIDNMIFERFNSGEERVRVIVDLKEEVVETRGFGIFSRSEFKKVDRSEVIQNSRIEERVQHQFIYSNSFSAELTKEEIEELEKNGKVKKIYQSYEIKTLLQDSVPLIKADETWNLQIEEKNMTGKDQTVCIIDTAIDFNHPSLQNKNLTCNINCYNQSCQEDCSFNSGSNHGTHVAGIFGAFENIKGVSIESNIVGVNVFSQNGGTTSIGNVLRGLDWCIENYQEKNISLISMSLGLVDNNNDEIPFTQYCDNYNSFINEFTQKINQATSQNISVVVATGNYLGSGSITAPACVENAIRVGSTTKNDQMVQLHNRWSLDMLVAPGQDIFSTINNGGVGSSTGTSMATPHVSGAIAIINQYLQLTNRTWTPPYIFDLLNSTGKQIPDPASGRNYSRIDVLAALLEIDVTPPIVNLHGIENGTMTTEVNQTLNCSAEDWQLENITLFLWNSSMNFNETKEISGTQNTSSWLFENLSEGKYYWTCNSSDKKGNEGFTSTKWFYIGDLFLEMTPEDEVHTKINETDFTCNITSSTNELKNISFFLWNSSMDLINESFENISGTQNQTIFNYTFQQEGNYTWGCEVFNQDNISVSRNYTIIYDTTPPFLTQDFSISKTHNSATISFETSEETNASIKLFGKENKSTDPGFYSNEHSFIFSGLSSSTYYEFNATFCDRAGNCNFSEGSFTTNNVPQTSGGGSGSPTSSGTLSSPSETVQPTIHNLENENLETGTTIPMKQNEKAEFFINERPHSLQVKEIFVSRVNVEIRSDPISLTLFLGVPEKLSLNSEQFYDLYIELVDIGNETAEIRIQEINETIVRGEYRITTMQYQEEKEKDYDPNLYWIILGIFIFSLIVVSWIHFVIENKNFRKKHKKK